MKTIAPVMVLLALVFSFALAAPVELKLKDGSVLKGEVTVKSPDADSVSVITDYGVAKVPVDKLTTESKAALGLSTAPTTPAQYEARIRTLEARIKALEAENANLRRELASSASTPAPSSTYRPTPSSRPAPQSLAPQSPPRSEPAPAAGGAYTISSTGKRHNSRCRYYGSGRACGPTDGVACKICGG